MTDAVDNGEEVDETVVAENNIADALNVAVTSG